MNISPTREALSVMTSLRPPSSRPLKLLYGFSSEVYSNQGYTFEIEAGESVICPGSGKVANAIKRVAKFAHTGGLLAIQATYEVTLTHGQGIQTLIGGLSTLAVYPGATVSRGDILGTPATNQIFFGVSYNQEVINPRDLGRHWWFQGEYVPGQAGNLRYAPDKLIRNFAGTVYSVISGGLRYFIDRMRGFNPLLLNVDFNGTGTKTGFGALGFTSADYWNVYAAGAFFWINGLTPCSGWYYYATYGPCGSTKVFNRNPQTFLNDSTGLKSPVWLERVAAAEKKTRS